MGGGLTGIAAECAVKAMMQEANIARLPKERRKDDPYFAHFPELRTMLRDTLRGRNSQTLQKFIQDDAFMNNWSTGMRYSDGKDIDHKWVCRWSDQASRVVNSIGS